MKRAAGYLAAIAFWVALLVLIAVSFVAAPFLMAVVVWFAKPTTKASGIPCLPRWLAWFNTPDDPTGEQGAWYEPQVAKWQARFGWRFKTWYWLGVRNQVNGLFAALAPACGANDVITASGPYPQAKGPYRAGIGLYTIRRGWLPMFEFKAVWPWSATRCGQFGIGWKVHTLNAPGDRVMFLLQLKPFLTINSAT